VDPARTFRPPQFSAPNTSAEPEPWTGVAAIERPGPFWGRVARALAVLIVASAGHVWLLRVPEPRPITEAAPTVTLAVRGPARSPSEAPVVTVVTELLSVGTAGIVPPRPPEPRVTTTPSVTIEATRAPASTPGPVTDRRRPAEAVRSNASEHVAYTPVVQPLSLTHSLSSAPQLSLPSARLAPARPSLVASQDSRRPNGQASAPRHAAEPDQQLVRSLLQQYVTAFERLDVEAAKAVWPTVDDKALRRAFDQLEAQHLTFQSCGITIEGSGANARCQGQASYRPRIGSHTLRMSPREWTFNLAKANDGWQIIDARVR
jgi:hypothetical protein